MANYVLERSNARHVGVVILQDGNSPFPLGDFVNECNGSMDLLISNSEFYSMMAKGMQSNDELNNLAKFCFTYGEQCKEWAVKIKSSGKPIYFLDKEYFKVELERAKRLTPNSPEQQRTCRTLYENFAKAIGNCVEWNKITARQLGLQPVQVKNK